MPIIVQVYLNAGLAYWLNRRLGVAWCVAGPSALIGAINFFELAVATAIVLFGFQSGAALATVVSILVEVPVMLSVVRLVQSTRGCTRAHAISGLNSKSRGILLAPGSPAMIAATVVILGRTTPISAIRPASAMKPTATP